MRATSYSDLLLDEICDCLIFVEQIVIWRNKKTSAWTAIIRVNFSPLEWKFGIGCCTHYSVCGLLFEIEGILRDLQIRARAEFDKRHELKRGKRKRKK